MFSKAICFELSGHHQTNTCNIRHTREVKKAFFLEIEISVLLQAAAHVYIISIIKIIVKIVTNT